MSQQFVGLVLYPTESSSSPHVVYEDVDRAKTLHRASHHGKHFVFVANVNCHVLRLSTKEIPEICGNSLSGVRVDICHHDVGTVGGKSAGDAFANSVARSRDDGGSSFKTTGHGCSSLSAADSPTERW